MLHCNEKCGASSFSLLPDASVLPSSLKEAPNSISSSVAVLGLERTSENDERGNSSALIDYLSAPSPLALFPSLLPLFLTQCSSSSAINPSSSHLMHHYHRALRGQSSNPQIILTTPSTPSSSATTTSTTSRAPKASVGQSSTLPAASTHAQPSFEKYPRSLTFRSTHSLPQHYSRRSQAHKLHSRAYKQYSRAQKHYSQAYKQASKHHSRAYRHQFRAKELHYRALKTANMAKRYGAELSTLTGVGHNGLPGSYPATPGFADDISPDSNSNLPSWPASSDGPSKSMTKLPNLADTPMASPASVIAHRRSRSSLAYAVDSAADVRGLPLIPDLHWDTRLSLESRPSFNTFVRDLVQSRPDSPIGGRTASPVAPKPKRSFNVGTLVTKGKSPPRIEISYASVPGCPGEDTIKSLKTRAYASETPETSGTGLENLNPRPRSSTQNGTFSTTPTMFTAPESPRHYARTDGSYDSVDIEGRQLAIRDMMDFAMSADGARSKKNSKVHASDPDYCEDCISPKTKVPKKGSSKTQFKPDDHEAPSKTEKIHVDLDPDRCEDCGSPSTSAPKKSTPHTRSKPPGTEVHKDSDSDRCDDCIKPKTKETKKEHPKTSSKISQKEERSKFSGKRAHEGELSNPSTKPGHNDEPLESSAKPARKEEHPKSLSKPDDHGVPSKKSPEVRDSDLDSGFCSDCGSPTTRAPKTQPPNSESKRDGQAMKVKIQAKTGKEETEKNAGKDETRPKTGTGAIAKAGSEGKGPRKRKWFENPADTEADEKNGNNSKSGTAVPEGILVDITGELPPPETPDQPKWRAFKAKGHLYIRKGRGLLLKEPVMKIMVGRQLAPPTAHGLQLIAKGVPIEVPDVVPLEGAALPE